MLSLGGTIVALIGAVKGRCKYLLLWRDIFHLQLDFTCKLIFNITTFSKILIKIFAIIKILSWVTALMFHISSGTVYTIEGTDWYLCCCALTCLLAAVTPIGMNSFSPLHIYVQNILQNAFLFVQYIQKHWQTFPNFTSIL